MPLLSGKREHFSVDGTLIETWASHESFRPKDGSDEGDGTNFHRQRRTNDTHASETDPQSRLCRKASGREAKLSYGPCDHGKPQRARGCRQGDPSRRHGRAACVGEHAEGDRQSRRARHHDRRRQGLNDTSDHVAALRAVDVTPHVAQNNSTTKTGKQRRSAIDDRTTRHAGYGMSQTRRAMIECIFGWGKQHVTMRKTKHRRIAGVGADFMLNLIAYNLIRIPKLLAA